MKILYFFYVRTDASCAVKLVIISAFFESFIFCSALETFFSSGTKMQCLQITLPTFFAYHILKFVFQRKELVIFDLILFWEQN